MFQDSDTKRDNILEKKKGSFYHHVSCPQETVICGISLLSETNIFSVAHPSFTQPTW